MDSKTLDVFLNPKRKENLKFALSDAFCNENGEPIEWEMRQLSATESMELQKDFKGKDYHEVMAVIISEALVFPNLKDAEFLKALSEREKRPILKASDALIAITTDAEIASLISTYNDYNVLVKNISKEIDEVKN